MQDATLKHMQVKRISRMNYDISKILCAMSHCAAHSYRVVRAKQFVSPRRSSSAPSFHCHGNITKAIQYIYLFEGDM